MRIRIIQGLLFLSIFVPVVKGNFDHAIQYSASQYRKIPASQNPIVTTTNGQWVAGNELKDWRGGFFTGSLWTLYELTKDEYWKTRATQKLDGLYSGALEYVNHDMGFRVMTSLGNAYRITGEEKYKQQLLKVADLMAGLYNPKVGCIKGWNLNVLGPPNVPRLRRSNVQFVVIIDTMMNIELLFWAAKNGGDQKFYDIAMSHALKVMQNHVRADGSTYHYVEYNPDSGAIVFRGTHQGYAHDSTWARGQGWAIHGFTAAYRYSKDERLLATARKVADYYISRMTPGKIPYWDLNLPSTQGEPVDTSSAAIAAAGLFELATFGGESNRYRSAALDLLTTLSKPPYLSEGERSQAIILKSVGERLRERDVGVSFSYTDYYFLQSILRHKTMGEPSSSSFNLKLSEGWNLISFPLNPVDRSINKVLGPINNRFDAVYAFDSKAGQYSTYVPGASGNSLTEISAGRGYWIYMNEAATLQITGSEAQKETRLSSGWNLIGLSSTRPVEISSALSSIRNKFEAVYSFETSSNSYKSYIPPDILEIKQLEPGRAYWLYASEESNWTLP